MTLACLALLGDATAAAAGRKDADAPTDRSPGVFAGQTLADALLALQSRGLAIVFTSRIVLPAMTVLSEPRASDPRSTLTGSFETKTKARGVMLHLPAPLPKVQALAQASGCRRVDRQ